MKSWQEKHPFWEYMLWDNTRVKTLRFKNQKHIEKYWSEKVWHGVADLMRYEILFTYGGFFAEADSVCLQPVDELFTNTTFDAYTVYENEKVRPGLTSPLIATTKDNEFAKLLIDTLYDRKELVGPPWKETGNLFMKQMIETTRYPRLKIFPSYYFIPTHYSGEHYEGPGPIYAEQLWGSTFDIYEDEADISLLKPRVRTLAEQLTRACKKEGIAIKIVRGFRSKEEQDHLYEQGRTRPGDIITMVKGGNSFHNYGVAFDFRTVAETKEEKERLCKIVGPIGEQLGLEWGGRWEELIDLPHFQYTGEYSIEDFKNNRVDWKKFN
jgi:hypothetical protein